MKKISVLLDSKYLYKCIYILALVMVIIFIMLYYFDINYTKQINLDNINVVNEDDFVVKIGFFEVKNNVMQVQLLSVLKDRRKLHRYHHLYVEQV